MSPGTRQLNERKVRHCTCRGNTRQQRGNPSLIFFVKVCFQRKFYTCTKTSSSQVSVEFDFNQEHSDSDLSEIAEAIVEHGPESAILASNALNSEPGPYMVELN